MGFEPAKAFQKALFEAGIPAASFETDDLGAELERLENNGVELRGEPQDIGGVRMVTFDDTCGNIICLGQKTG
jgi:predicted enzyme related to lactoylglutathione lyase